jgi:hypothetical protein
MSHCGLAIYIQFFLKGYLIRQKKEELWKLKLIFHHAKIIIFFQKSAKKETKILQEIIILTLGTNLKFQHKPRICIIFPKSSYKNRPIIILSQGPKSLQLLLYSMMNLNTISLPW